MWSRSYRNHVIMAFPSFDTTTNSWAPQADISWCAGPIRDSEFVRFTPRANSEDEAVSCALHSGVTWIDQRLKHLRHGERAVRERGGGLIAGLQHNLKRTPSRQSLFQIARPASQAKTLTFDQFKSVMGKLGFSGSEHLLRKSYDALIKLRKSRHCSWAEIRAKMQQSHGFPSAVGRSRRRPQGARLPLTPQAWRRIV
jgi:hypothetical protein